MGLCSMIKKNQNGSKGILTLVAIRRENGQLMTENEKYDKLQ